MLVSRSACTIHDGQRTPENRDRKETDVTEIANNHEKKTLFCRKQQQAQTIVMTRLSNVFLSVNAYTMLMANQGGKYFLYQ